MSPVDAEDFNCSHGSFKCAVRTVVQQVCYLELLITLKKPHPLIHHPQKPHPLIHHSQKPHPLIHHPQKPHPLIHHPQKPHPLIHLCSFPQVCKNPNCQNRRRFMLDVNASRFVDFQKVRIQETQQELPRGSIPRRWGVGGVCMLIILYCWC